MAPWIFFLFMGTLDFGFYAYAIIATQNAARVAVMQTSLNSTTAANSTGTARRMAPRGETTILTRWSGSLADRNARMRAASRPSSGIPPANATANRAAIRRSPSGGAGA